MKCESCGMEITGKGIVKEIDGVKRYFCCEGCAKSFGEHHHM